ncbi:hypothetical protein HanIR_Chr07g0332141 [Helianthus annuus]|nr:hypothetical protein HanIR_Chr07g0332141 [Helianthus annuus]
MRRRKENFVIFVGLCNWILLADEAGKLLCLKYVGKRRWEKPNESTTMKLLFLVPHRTRLSSDESFTIW